MKTALTTTDNPYSPFDQFDSWYAYDVASGYKTCEFLARITNNSYESSIGDYELAVEQAIDEIVKENVLGIYRKVTPDFYH